MEIEINIKNRKIISDSLSKTIEIIQEIATSEAKKQPDIKKLVLLDLVFRQYPNLNSIDLLFNQYFSLNNTGNTLPIGLIMRCSLEDMIFAKYLLTFKDKPNIFENEILVQSKNAVKEYLEYVVLNEPEYWMCSDEKKEEVRLLNIESFNGFKKENPEFFDEFGKVKNFRKLRKDVPEIRQYFDSETIQRQGPCNMYKRLKVVDLQFSYIYFLYKFYCLYEHYSFHTRKILELNKFTFGYMALSTEFILRSLKDILEYARVDTKYVTKIRDINKSLAELLKIEENT